MFHRLFLIIFLVFSVSLFGQKEANNWAFGYGAGLDFSTSPPTFFKSNLTVPSGLFTEGGTSISDAAGNLLFYSDGQSLYRGNGTRVTNKLRGSFSAAQSGLVIPHPGDPNLYYLFTLDDFRGGDGFRYTTYDISKVAASGEVGDLVTPLVGRATENVTTNVTLIPTTTTLLGRRSSGPLEGLTAVARTDKLGFWVIVKKGISDPLTGSRSIEFHVYGIDATGLSTTSKIYSLITGYSSDISQIKASPDGTHLAVSFLFREAILLLDFDAATGIVSNLRDLPNLSARRPIIQDPYGLEFSPSGQYLYVSERGTTSSFKGSPGIFRYDISPTTIGNPAQIGSDIDIVDYPTAFGFGAGAYLGGLQMGPDGVIYIAVADNLFPSGKAADVPSAYVGTIKNPDDAAPVLNYQSVLLRNTTDIAYSSHGLPAFITSFFKPPALTITPNCNGNYGITTAFPARATGVTWDFGDPSSGALNNTSTLRTPVHTYAASGDYLVSVEFTVSGAVQKVTETVRVVTTPVLNLGSDTTLCFGATLNLDGGKDLTAIQLAGATYKWSEKVSGAVLPTVVKDFQVTTPGNYEVEVTYLGCTVKDAIVVDYIPEIKLNLGSDTTLCFGATLNLDGGKDLTATQLAGATYKWSDGSTSRRLRVRGAGNYKVEVKYLGCTVKDAIVVNYVPEIKLNLGSDTTLCYGAILDLDGGKSLTAAQLAGATYKWSDGSTSRRFRVRGAGNYEVEVTYSGCTVGSKVEVKYYDLPKKFLRDTLLCYTDEVRLDAGRFETYLWNTGAVGRYLTVRDPDRYEVDLTYAGGRCFHKDVAEVRRTYGANFEARVQDRTISVDVLGGGTSPYDYSLDGEHYQNTSSYGGLLPGTYYVWVRDRNGCVAKSVALYVRLEVPKYFSPNGDGINDRWRPSGLEWYTSAQVQVYDRYGRLMYRNKGRGGPGWDGRFEGAMQPQTDYWYIIELEDDKGNKVLKGHFTLLIE